MTASVYHVGHASGLPRRSAERAIGLAARRRTDFYCVKRSVEILQSSFLTGRNGDHGCKVKIRRLERGVSEQRNCANGEDDNEY